MATNAPTSISKHRVICCNVYRGLELDDAGLAAGAERQWRGQMFADGWIDDESFIREAIPIAPSVWKDFWVGDRRPHTDIYDRAWAEGDERHGLKITANDIGPQELPTFSFTGPAPDGTRRFEHPWPAQNGNYFVVEFSARTGLGTGESCNVTLLRYEHDASGETTLGSLTGVDDTATWTTDPLLQRLDKDQLLAVQVDSCVGDGDGKFHLVVKVTLRLIVGE